MKTFQLIFKGGRVQNLLADHWSHEDDMICFEAGLTTHEFSADSVIRIDDLTEDGWMTLPEEEMSFDLSVAGV